MTKRCPLYPEGFCDYPGLLGEFPADMQERCASGGRCLLRVVQVLGTDDGTGERLNFVRAWELSERFKHLGGMSISLTRFRQSIRDYTRGVLV